MNVDDFMLWKIQQDDRLRDIVNNTSSSAQMGNIKSIRNLVTHFITIAAAIVGFTLPVFGRTELIKNPFFLIAGLAELLILIIFGFWYLSRVLQKENIGLVNQQRRYNAYIDEVIEARNKFFTTMTEEKKNEWFEVQKKGLEKLKSSEPMGDKPDYALDIIFAAFFIALILITLSLIEVPKIS